MSEEKSIGELAREHCNLLMHKIDILDVYSAFILGARAQRKICDTEEAKRFVEIIHNLIEGGIVTEEEISAIVRGL